MLFGNGEKLVEISWLKYCAILQVQRLWWLYLLLMPHY